MAKESQKMLEALATVHSSMVFVRQTCHRVLVKGSLSHDSCRPSCWNMLMSSVVAASSIPTVFPVAIPWSLSRAVSTTTTAGLWRRTNSAASACIVSPLTFQPCQNLFLAYRTRLTYDILGPGLRYRCVPKRILLNTANSWKPCVYRWRLSLRRGLSNAGMHHQLIYVKSCRLARWSTGQWRHTHSTSEAYLVLQMLHAKDVDFKARQVMQLQLACLCSS